MSGFLVEFTRYGGRAHGIPQQFHGLDVYMVSTDTAGTEGAMTSSDPKLQASIARIRATMKSWGITNSRLASELGVSRQYLWQVVHRRVHLSPARADEIERVLNHLVADSRHHSTFGERLRAARRSAGFTLKEVASMIGYSWAGVERWEKDQCRPKPGVLFHLMSIYNSSSTMLEVPPPVRPLEAVTPSPAFLFAGQSGGALGEFQVPLHTRARAHSPGVTRPRRAI
jgi:transcriptional regulator with XRE-family HTH domain